MTSAANKSVRFAVLITLCVSAGCSLAHQGKPPPQQFLEALQRGEAPQASQIWLHMSASDRAKLAHGSGLKPEVTPAAVRAAMLKARAAQESRDGGGAFQDYGDGERVEFPSIDHDGLLKLPSYDSKAPNGAASGGS